MKRFMDSKIIAAFVVAFVLGTTLAVTVAKPEGTSMQAQTQPGSLTNTISVSGSGEASGTPNVANVQLGIQVTDADAGKALSQANDTIAKVTKAIEDAGVAEADIQTSGFNLYPQNPPDQPVPATAGGDSSSIPAPRVTYQAQILLSVHVKDISKIGAVIDAGTKAGANTVAGLSFGIDDPSKLEAEARTKAVANAHDRAQQLATALNMTLGDPVMVSESTGGGIQPVAFRAAVGGAATQVNPGQLDVSIDVQITYSMSKK